MEEKMKSRTAIMAETYAKKLKEIQPQTSKKMRHLLEDATTPEREEKLKQAKAKLKSFWED